MQFTCNKEELNKALQIAIRAINTSATLEALQGVLITVEKNKTTIKATNLEVGVEINIPTIDTVDGSVLVNPKTLIDAIKYSHSKKVTIQKNKNTIIVKLQTGETTIKTLNDSDFPNIQKNTTGEIIQIQAKKIIQGIRSVLYAVSHSIIKPELASVYMWQDEQQLVFVATDSFRLAEKRINQNTTSIDTLSVLIPHKNTQDLVGILEQLDEDTLMDMYVDTDQFSLYAKGVYITLRTINGVFPDYQKIIPDNPSTEVTLLKQDVSQIIKKAGIFSDEFHKIIIQTNREKQGIVVSTHNGKAGNTTDTLTGVLEGEDVSISVNYKYILDCFQSIQSDSVVLSFFGQNKPIIIKGVGDKSFTYLVMPMNN